MKKTLAAVAVLGAFAGSALAADVTIYGRIDTGLQYTNTETTDIKGVTAEDTAFKMVSGGSTTSRLGIKGSEQISENLTVGFVLEKGLTIDDGTSSNDTMFDRESTVWAKTNFGTVYAGRISSLMSDGGSMAMWGKHVAFGSGTGGSFGAGYTLLATQSRASNRISYMSPEFAGFKVAAEYSMGGGTYGEYEDEVSTEENTREYDREAALGVEYNNGAFGGSFVVATVFEDDFYSEDDGKLSHTGHGKDPEDQWTVSLAADYDFGVAKVYVAGQYFKDANTVGTFEELSVLSGRDELEGYGFVVGADIPLAGGLLTVGGAYTDGEDKAKDSKIEFDGWNVGAQYKYQLSKRTRVYATVGYTNLEAETGLATDETNEYKYWGGNVGIAHYF
jgi:predicted porin